MIPIENSNSPRPYDGVSSSDSSLGMCEWTGCPGTGTTVPSSSFHATKRHAYIRAPEHTPDPEPHPRLALVPVPDPSSSTSVTSSLEIYELDDLDLFYDF